jgi:23S rRNA (adenine2503-C2)-methyltransferase
MLEIISKSGNDNLATVYVAKTAENKYLEFVESVQPPYDRNEKWVLIVSTLFGCPVNCPICDAGGFYHGKLSKAEILAQIDFLINTRYPNQTVPCKKFKIQFARMGEPTLNPAVLETLTELPQRYSIPGLLPSISTIAPKGCDNFLAELCHTKNNLYANGKFQMQFSLHTTNQKLRHDLIPVDKWDFAQIAAFGKNFFQTGDQKITLNFALAKNSPIEVSVLKQYFDPKIFIIKITPINPTFAAAKNNLDSYFTTGAQTEDTNNILSQIKSLSYDVILSIGELEENQIGSNCGQYLNKQIKIDESR